MASLRKPPGVKPMGVLFSLAVLAALAVLVLLVVARLDLRPRTDDAYLQADLVHMAPDVSGRIVALAVQNNQAVRAGDALFVIDPEPYRLRVEQARAQLHGLEAQLAVQTDQVVSETAKADAAQSGVGSARAELTLATLTLTRLEPLGRRGFVTSQQVDQARTAERTAQISLLQSEQQATQARSAVTSTRPLQEQVAGARAALSLAERDLRLTVARAPCAGRITALDVAVGEFAAAGVPLFTIIDTERWYAEGNFRETDLAGIRAGQRATVFVMSAPRQPLQGTVDSLGWGVTPDEGSTAGGLPRVPRSLNWVRIAQRFPVRVLLDRPPETLMRVAASAVIVIDR